MRLMAAEEHHAEFDPGLNTITKHPLRSVPADVDLSITHPRTRTIERFCTFVRM